MNETNGACCNIDIHLEKITTLCVKVYGHIKLSCKVCREFITTFVKKMKCTEYLKLSAFQSVLFSIMTDILSSDLLNIPPKCVCWNVLATISYIFPITFSKNIHPVDIERKLNVWTFYLHSIYVLCLRGNSLNSLFQIQMFLFPNTVLLLFLLKMPQCIFKFC